MDDRKHAEILDKMTKVCTCKGISRATIKKAIQNGFHTIDELKQATGAMTGACKGRNCQVKIEKLLKEYKNSEN